MVPKKGGMASGLFTLEKILNDRPCDRVACECEISIVHARPTMQIYPKTFYRVQNILMFMQLSPAEEW